MDQTYSQRIKEKYEKQKQEAIEKGKFVEAGSHISSGTQIKDSVAKLGKEYTEFLSNIKVESIGDTINKILSTVQDVSTKIDNLSTKDPSVPVNTGVLYVNMDDTLLDIGKTQNVTVEKVISIVRLLKNISIVNVGPSRGIDIDDVEENNVDYDRETDYEDEDDEGMKYD
ncbi:hypothetical protein IW140_006002 [Coemansia sp. RSA 1813]|nr:hypothetical protein EV178_005916 [Coemansia sp. RSA 1646]KAJ1767222.1 hypothetical protein LPJ74_005490 [Coemansia sp. RSA 1843]KAJ2086310.1 hypothetical protein IW138_005775 [Coemansia sp. RSA 986]KAJ2210805.1 hypothetical protein EV179_005982 [Coemansia sp. RSA 487]KAJ2563738.1 hypothetical protein IW140_006002 [Coemansia sp. RSA 1813]